MQKVFYSNPVGASDSKRQGHVLLTNQIASLPCVVLLLIASHISSAVLTKRNKESKRRQTIRVGSIVACIEAEPLQLRHSLWRWPRARATARASLVLIS